MGGRREGRKRKCFGGRNWKKKRRMEEEQKSLQTYKEMMRGIIGGRDENRDGREAGRSER